MSRVSTLSSKLLITPILSLTLAPPIIAANGCSGSVTARPTYSISFSNRKPAAAGRKWVTPSTEAWARWDTPKPSFTYKSAREASCSANSISFFSSSLWKRRFSKSRIWPGFSFLAAALASAPTQSGAKRIFLPSSLPKCLATGAKLYLGFTCPLGRPRCAIKITAALLSKRY